MDERERQRARRRRSGPQPSPAFLTKTKNAATVAGANSWRARGGRQRERRVCAAASGRERDQRDGCEQRGDAGRTPCAGWPRPPRRRRGTPPARARSARGGEQLRVDTGEPGDARDQHVPQRERVARVQPAVHELVHGVEREVVERLELAHAREMEERIAVELPGDSPESDAEADAGQADADGGRRRPAQRLPRARRAERPRRLPRRERAPTTAALRRRTSAPRRPSAPRGSRRAPRTRSAARAPAPTSAPGTSRHSVAAASLT